MSNVESPNVKSMIEKRSIIRNEYSEVADPLLASAYELLPVVLTLSEFNQEKGFLVAFKHKKDMPINTVQIGQPKDNHDNYNIENDLIFNILKEEHHELKNQPTFNTSAVMTFGDVIVGISGFDKKRNTALLMGIALNARLVGYDESIQKIHQMSLDAAAIYNKYIKSVFYPGGNTTSR